MSEQQMRVFVSHSHEDDTFCRAVVAGLRGAGADVWYDEHNLDSGQLMAVIQRELGRRPVVVAILSKAAFASSWVRREITWAYELMDRDPSRILLPVTGGPIERSDFDPEQGWLFLHDFKRIEASGLQPYPTPEAVRRVLQALMLPVIEEASPPEPVVETPSPALSPATPATPVAPVAPVAAAIASTSSEAAENPEDLLFQGKALAARRQFTEALPLLERATQLSPRSFDAWFNLGSALKELAFHDTLHGSDSKGAERGEQALAAFEQATALDPTNARAWAYKGDVLRTSLRRDKEALAAYDEAIARDPTDAHLWFWKGTVLEPPFVIKGMSAAADAMVDDAMAAYERSIELNSNYFMSWQAKARLLFCTERYAEALATYERLIELLTARQGRGLFKGELYSAWVAKGDTLSKLHRYLEAVAAYEQTIALGVGGHRVASVWKSKGDALFALKRHKDALAAYEQAATLEPKDWKLWIDKGATLYELHRYREAVAAYEQSIALHNNTRAWLGKADALRKLWRKAEAIEAERRASEAVW